MSGNFDNVTKPLQEYIDKKGKILKSPCDFDRLVDKSGRPLQNKQTCCYLDEEGKKHWVMHAIDIKCESIYIVLNETSFRQNKGLTLKRMLNHHNTLLEIEAAKNEVQYVQPSAQPSIFKKVVKEVAGVIGFLSSWFASNKMEVVASRVAERVVPAPVAPIAGVLASGLAAAGTSHVISQALYQATPPPNGPQPTIVRKSDSAISESVVGILERSLCQNNALSHDNGKAYQSSVHWSNNKFCNFFKTKSHAEKAILSAQEANQRIREHNTNQINP